jgi:hypothetical protein
VQTNGQKMAIDRVDHGTAKSQKSDSESGSESDYSGSDVDMNRSGYAKTADEVTSAYGPLLRERCKYIPLRLTYRERQLHKLYKINLSCHC